MKLNVVAETVQAADKWPSFAITFRLLLRHDYATVERN